MSDKLNTTDEIRNSVRENYAAVARSNSGCLPSEGESGCCGTGLFRPETRALGVGCSEAELAAAPGHSARHINPTSSHLVMFRVIAPASLYAAKAITYGGPI